MPLLRIEDLAIMNKEKKNTFADLLLTTIHVARSGHHHQQQGWCSCLPKRTMRPAAITIILWWVALNKSHLVQFFFPLCTGSFNLCYFNKPWPYPSVLAWTWKKLWSLLAWVPFKCGITWWRDGSFDLISSSSTDWSESRLAFQYVKLTSVLCKGHMFIVEIWK